MDLRVGPPYQEGSSKKESKHVLWYFDRYTDFQKDTRHFDLLFLDFFLDKDGIKSSDIFASVRLRATNIVAFSSCSEANQTLLDLGADFAVEKERGIRNEKLEELVWENVL